ncbi:hypothetical protein AB0F81_04740 [Actinoplanes sp. NPDC024001]|uniref:hypothetical protein n=1 Tax=Actinoplanes sp. NPDC024001 TaxID=3154598 RepID=UPI0033EC5C1A
MRHRKIRQIAAAGTLALIATIPLAACGDPAVSPRPGQAAANETPAASGQTPASVPSAPAQAGDPQPGVARQPAGQKPEKTRTVKPTTSRPAPAAPTSTKPTGTCHGAVRYDLDLQNTVLDLVRSMCFHTGGVLRLQGIGPGLVTATPGSLVSQSYEGGVVDLRFVRPGTVTVTIPQDEKTYTITVVVVS